MFKRVFWLMLAVVLCAAPAWAQVRGMTAPLSPSEIVEIIYDPVAPTRFIAQPSATDKSGKADAIGAYYLGYYLNWVWTVDPTVGELAEPELPTLPASLQAAVDVAPDWLKPALARRFYEMDVEDAEPLAELIVNPDDERYTDEIAFCVTYLSEFDLRHMEDPANFLVENARLIYANDATLDYVEVIDSGTVGEGDYYTTLRYNIREDGVVESVDLPKEIYYWNVVHPKLDVETPNFVVPSTGNETTMASGGLHWRDYLLFDADGENSYTAPMYFAGVDEADLQTLNPSAVGYLELTIHNLEIAYVAGTKNVVLTEFAYGNGAVFATTMRLEDAYSENDCPLLPNLLKQGNGDVLLSDDAQIALIQDHNITDFETALTELGLWDNTTILAPADVQAYDETAWTTFKDTYDKVILPPYQGLDFATMIADADVAANLESFVSGYGVLQMHLILPPKIKAKDMTYPCGVSTVFDDTYDDITLYGRPLLADMLDGIEVMWDLDELDENLQTNLDGDRDLWDNADAVQVIGNWTGKNLLDNIQERGVVTGGSPERALQPARIVYNHFGNCGELQDLTAAAMRALLIPSQLVSTINEDHVWGEFYHDDDWHAFQVDWSNGRTQINNFGVAYDAGKNITIALAWIGDGQIASATSRYSEVVTLEFNVTDSNGEPVPDATVEIWVDPIYGGGHAQGFWLLTDDNGHAEVEVGENQSYYMRILSSIGDYPKQDAGRVRVLEMVDAEDNTVGGLVFTLDHQFDRPLIDVTTDKAGATNDSFGLHVQLTATQRFAGMYNPFSRAWAFPERTTPKLDVLLIDADNLTAARNNEAFEAAYTALGVASLDETIYPPTAGDWHLLIVNHSATASDHLLDISVTAEGDPWTPGDDDSDDDDDDDDATDGDDDDDDDDSGCCGC